MANAGTVTVDFAAEVAKFNAQMKQVNDRVKSVESSFKSLQKVADAALRIFTAGIATNFIKSAADAADALGKTADKLGISTERLTAFQLAAADAGVETATLTKLLTDAQRRLGEAAGGSGAALDAIQALGLSVRELQQLSPDQLFLRYADAITKLNSRSEQFAIAQDLFGKSAQEAFTLIAAGRPAIDEAIATVDRLGLALSRVDIAQIEVANDKLALLARTSQAFGQQLAAAIAPFVTEFVDRVTGVGVAADDTRGKLDSFARGVFITFELLANGARVFDAAVSTAFLAFAKSAEIANGILRSSFELTAELDAAVGLDSLAERFRGFAAVAAEAESFAAALSEQAAQRVQNAASNIKSFAQLFDEADQIVARSQARAEEAAAKQAELAEGLTGESIFENLQFQFSIEEELQRSHFDTLLQQQQDYLTISNQIEEDLGNEEFRRRYDEKVAIAQKAEEQILQVKQQFQASAIGLLQALAVKSKAAAIALVLINKGKAIAEAIQNTEVAATLQLSTGDPYTAAARAAAVRAMGYASVAAIAATGFVEIQNIRSSSAPGAPLGGPQNPIFTSSAPQANGEVQQPGARQRPIQTVNVYGWSEQAIRDLIRIMRETGSDYDLQIERRD